MNGGGEGLHGLPELPRLVQPGEGVVDRVRGGGGGVGPLGEQGEAVG